VAGGDPAGEPVEPIARFLRDFAARDNRAGSVRSYYYALLRWWRWLKVIEVEWDQVTSAEVRDFVLWLGQAVKPRLAARTVSAATGGNGLADATGGSSHQRNPSDVGFTCWHGPALV
jgi:integrase/recombinase XerD